MATYDKCQADVMMMADNLIKLYHQDVGECGVTISYLFAYAPRDKDNNIKGSALRSASGTPAAAKVERTSLKDRAQGKTDAVIIIDGDMWPTIDDDQRRAILDHELFHIVVKRDRHGQVVTDDASRPTIQLRKHDYENWGFKVIAERHKNASVEVQCAQRLVSEFGGALMIGTNIS